MIAGLNGKLEAIGGDSAIIDVGGISFQVYMPTSTLSTFGAIGEEVRVHTYFHLREDNAALYGFASADELGLFQTLIGVSGLGPKLALAMLSAMSAEKLTMAIATGSADVLTMVPGVGKKMADRLILELKEKIGAGLIAIPAAQIAQDVTRIAQQTDGEKDPHHQDILERAERGHHAFALVAPADHQPGQKCAERGRQSQQPKDRGGGQAIGQGGEGRQINPAVHAPYDRQVQRFPAAQEFHQHGQKRRRDDDLAD